MVWRFLRATNGLTSDPEWHGVLLTDPTAPPIEDFVPIGGRLGAEWRDGAIDVRVGWLDAIRQPVAVQGSATIQVVTLDRLPMPDVPTQLVEIMSLGQEKVDIGPWLAEPLPCPPRGRATVRVTAMTPPVGATQMGVWYWQVPAASIGVG